MESGLVFNIQRFSIHDGPGIRTTVFLKGCPLDCWWCHNPEGQAAEAEIVVVEGRCIRCDACRKACPQTRAAGGTRAAEQGACTLCGACVAACPTGARQMVGRRRTVDEVLAEVLKDRLFYDDSGGGATFSGGEPLLQPGFLKGLLLACRARGIRTAVDTCGFGSEADLLAVAPLADLFLYDLKFMDDAQHARYTGASNATILSNLRALGRVHGNIWIRIPILPGLNDGPEHLEAMAHCAASTPGVRQVNVLPYHEAGTHKLPRLGRPHRLEDMAPPSAEYVEEVAARFRGFGLTVKIGG